MTTDDDLGGIHRRSLIKRGVIAGGTAWVAPMLIDSVLSPAAAVSLEAGYTKTTPGTDTVDIRAGIAVSYVITGAGGGGGGDQGGAGGARTTITGTIPVSLVPYTLNITVGTGGGGGTLTTG
ncbi:MAG: hypothetical protein ABL966_12310, partial [Acidimicrobiales bacterium]